MKTIFCDIDGTIFKWKWPWDNAELLPGVKEKFEEWLSAGCVIILTTARDSAYREMTEQQLMDFGIYYHALLMDLPDYPRHIINDEKHGVISCAAHIVKRDGGLEDLDI
jgi:hypothetical protein